MREILFRGKRKDNSEWVEGSLILTTSVKEKTYIVDSCYCYDGCIDEDGYADFDRLNAFEVIPSTVGQYTGLTDKNGTNIFEGDIVTMPAYHGGKKKAIVYFKNGKFAVDGSNYSFKDICSKRMEVIGNIYDNKEILDVK